MLRGLRRLLGLGSLRQPSGRSFACEVLEERWMMFVTGSSWGVTNISYSYSNFLDSAPGWANGLSRVDMQNATEEAMGLWTAVTPLRIFARADSGPAASDTEYAVETHPTFRWGHHFIDGPGMPGGTNVLGHGYSPGTSGLAGDMHYDDANTFTIDGMLELGAHEFGHALGMRHPNGDVVGGVAPPPFPAIMHALIGGGGTWDFNGLETGFLHTDDIDGIRSLYGAGLGYVIDTFGELNVYGGSGNDLLSVDFFDGNIIVSSSIVGGGFAGSFSRPINDGQTTINSIQLHGLGGNDVLRVVNSNGVRVNYYGGPGDDVFDVGFASNTLTNIGEAQIFAGAGNDSAFAYDGNNNGGQTYSVTSTRFDRSGWGGLRFFDDLENRTLTTGNTANTVNVFNTSTNRPTLINNGGGADVVNLGSSNSLQQIQGSVAIQNDPSFTTLNLNNSADAVARTLVVSQIAGNVGQLTGLAPGTISWDNADIAAINVTTGTGADAVNVFGVSEIMQITNAGGRDTVAVGSSINGMQSITGNLTIRAAFGTDQPLLLNDANSSTARAATMTAVGIDYTIAGLATGNVTFRDFGGVSVFHGNGGDTFTLSNMNLGPRLEVFGGGGGDAFVLNAVNNYGEGLGGTFVSALNLDGGTGINALSINDAARALATGYALYPNRFFSREPTAFANGADFTYDNMSSVGITCNNQANGFGVFGVSSDIDPGNQVTINLNGGNDIADVYPHDGSGNLTINGNIGIIGAAGTDLMRIQDAGATNPINYSFSNPFGSGTQNVFGLGTRGLGTAAIETWEINAGNGDDTFAVNQYTSGTALTLNGGLGNDLCDFGNNDVAGNVTSIASFLFNGMEGTDIFNLRNATPANTFSYTALGNTTLQVSRTFPSSYFVTLEYYNTEQKVVYAGPADDVMGINSFASGELSFHGAGGNDAVNLPASSDLLGQRFNFFGGAGTANRINQISNSKSTPTTLHVGENTIGAFPGDNFFEAGGSVYFESVQTVQLRMGSNTDSAVVQPDAVAAISIVGGNPTTAPGDSMNLALATTQNYVINGTAANGSVTSSNRQTVTYSGFETGPGVDDQAPTADVIDVTPDPRYNAVNSIDVQFSEPMFGVDLSDFSLKRDGGPNLLTGSETLTATNNSTTWTLGGLAPLTASRGTYVLTLTAAGSGMADLYGNVVAADAVDSWALVLPSWLAQNSVASWNPATSTLTVTGATTIVADPGLDVPTINASVPAAVLTFDPTADLQVHVAALNLSGGATATLASLGGARTASNHRVLVLNALGVDAASTLDIADNDLILDYSGASPIIGIEGDVASGYNITGDWLGKGITSSIAQLDGNYAVAVADNALLPAPFGSAQGGANFAGVDVDLTTVLVKFTHRADVNLDGLVSPDDSAVFGGNYDENQFAIWSTGDLNYDGLFTPDDAAIFGGAYDETLLQI